eukprot:NODE_77_length_23806_cov_0.393892.p3 type:complete len:299 gc:universal NODE_77_length_23806_cov_0.393892:23259-22363(-)
MHGKIILMMKKLKIKFVEQPEAPKSLVYENQHQTDVVNLVEERLYEEELFLISNASVIRELQSKCKRDMTYPKSFVKQLRDRVKNQKVEVNDNIFADLRDQNIEWMCSELETEHPTTYKRLVESTKLSVDSQKRGNPVARYLKGMFDSHMYAVISSIMSDEIEMLSNYIDRLKKKRMGCDDLATDLQIYLETVPEEEKNCKGMRKYNFARAFDRNSHNATCEMLQLLIPNKYNRRLMINMTINQMMVVRIGPGYSTPRSLQTGLYQGSVLSALYFAKLLDMKTTNRRTSTHFIGTICG